MAEQPESVPTLTTPPEASKRWWEIFRPGWKADEATRLKVTRAFALAGALAVLWLVLNLIWWGAQLVGADSAMWDQVVQAKAIMFRVKLAPHLGGAAIACAVVAFHALDHTKLGVRLFKWTINDVEGTEAAKTFNAGLVFAALLIVFGLLAASCLGK